jgi:hypothetical protein
MLDREEEEDLEGVGSRNGSRQRAREAGIQGVQVLDDKGEPASDVPSGSRITVRVHARYAATVEESALGITLHSKRAGVDVFSTDTSVEKTPLGQRQEGEQVTVDFTFGVPLQPGSYNVAAALYDAQGEILERMDAAATFKLTRSGEERPLKGLVLLPTAVEIHSPDGEQEKSSRSA